VHLHATDVEDPDSGEWLIEVNSGRLTHSKEHAKGDVAVRAPVVDLLLLATNRRRPDEIGAEVFGDTDVLDRLGRLAAL
jgi:predicted lipid carrier protein YhbT